MSKTIKIEGIIATLYTGCLYCRFADFQEFAEELLGKSIWTHHFGDKKLWEELRKAHLKKITNYYENKWKNKKK